MTVLAAVMSGMAALLWRPTGRWLVGQRLGATRMRGSVRGPTTVAVAIAAVLGGPALASVSPPHVLLAITGGLIGLFAVRQVRAEHRRRRADRHRVEVTESVGLMAAELRAGVLPRRSLAGLAADFGFLRPVSHAAELGGDVSMALREASAMPGGELLAELSGAWYVAERSGAPLARVLGRLEATAREERETDREVQSGLAPARATGRLMAVLPIFGLGLGSGMGGDPLAILTDTWPGAMCLAAGAALSCAGVAWIERIAMSGDQT